MYLDRCRNCKDEKGWHRDCGQQINQCFKCICLRYIPSDNLEYLEWLYRHKVGNNTSDVKI